MECCYLKPSYTDEKVLLSCSWDADFTILGIPAHPDDETHSCITHLGEMIGTPDWRSNPNGSWLIYAVTS